MATHWTLEDLYRGVSRSWWVLLATIAIFIGIAVAVFAVFPKTYTAQSQHTVEPISVLSSGSSFNTVNMETERVIATSTAVLDRAVKDLDGVSIDELRDSTMVEVPRNSQVLVFEVTADTPAKAADWANALADAYGQERTTNARAVVDSTAAELKDSIVQLQKLAQSQPAGSSARAATQQQLQALLDEQARLTATPFFSGILVTPATEPQSSNRPSILVFIAAALFLGLLLGGIAALIVSRARDTATRTYKRGRKHAEQGELSSLDGFVPDDEETPAADTVDTDPEGQQDAAAGPLSAVPLRKSAPVEARDSTVTSPFNH